MMDRKRIPAGVPTFHELRMDEEGNVRIATVHGGEYAPQQRMLGNVPYVNPKHRLKMTMIRYDKSRRKVVECDIAKDVHLQRWWKEQWREWARKHEGIDPKRVPPLKDAYERASCLLTIARRAVVAFKGEEHVPSRFYLCTDDTSMEEMGEPTPVMIRAVCNVAKRYVLYSPEPTSILLLAAVSPPEVFKRYRDDLIYLAAHEFTHGNHVISFDELERKRWQVLHRIFGEAFGNEIETAQRVDEDPTPRVPSDDEVRAIALADTLTSFISSSIRMDEGISALIGQFTTKLYLTAMGESKEKLGVDLPPSHEDSTNFILALVDVAAEKRKEIANIVFNAMKGDGALFKYRVFTEAAKLYGLTDEELKEIMSHRRVRLFVTDMIERRRVSSYLAVWKLMQFLRRVGEAKRQHKRFDITECEKIADELRYHEGVQPQSDWREKAFDELYQLYVREVVKPLKRRRSGVT